MSWDRNTPWRQGSVVSPEGFFQLGLAGTGDTRGIALVISHDCDLARPPEAEPQVELIVAKRVERGDGNLTHAKNARLLHLPLFEAGNEITIELSANGKLLVAKASLEYRYFDGTRVLHPQCRPILQTWLASRYRRPAFPNEFENRLRNKKVHDQIRKIMTPYGQEVIAVFFEVDRGASVERTGESDLYELEIILLYSTQHDSTKAEAVTKVACEKITTAFEAAFFDASTSSWKNIELASCTSYSDEEMSYALAQKLQKWNSDHLSLRTDPPGSLLN